MDINNISVSPPELELFLYLMEIQMGDKLMGTPEKRQLQALTKISLPIILRGRKC